MTHLQADCQEPGSALETYARQSSTVRLLFTVHSMVPEALCFLVVCLSVCACVRAEALYDSLACRRLLVFYVAFAAVSVQDCVRCVCYHLNDAVPPSAL